MKCIKLRPWYATHDTEYTVYFPPLSLGKFGWNLGCHACRVPSPLGDTHDVPQGHYVKTTSSTKPEVHNIGYIVTPSTGPRAQATWIKCDEVRQCGFRAMRADRQTDIHN